MSPGCIINWGLPSNNSGKQNVLDVDNWTFPRGAGAQAQWCEWCAACETMRSLGGIGPFSPLRAAIKMPRILGKMLAPM